MFGTILKLLPFILQMMSIGERLLGPKQGARKKALVVEAAKVGLGVIQGVSTGGQLETWQRIAGPVSGIVDLACEMLFPDHTEDEGAGP